MKGLFLAVLAAVMIGMGLAVLPAHAETVAEVSPLPDLTNEASHLLTVRVEGVGHTLSGHRSPDVCFVNDAGDVECLITSRMEAPIVGYRLYYDGVYFGHVDGDEWCNQQIERGGRDATTPGCVWGFGHIYTLVVTIGAGGDYEASYTHEQQMWYLGLDAEGNPKYGPVGGSQGIIAITKECRALVREWRESGEYGPAPECAAHRYYKEQDSSLVIMD